MFLLGDWNISSRGLVVSTIRLFQHSKKVWRYPIDLNRSARRPQSELVLTAPHTGNRLLVAAYGDHALFGLSPYKMWFVVGFHWYRTFQLFCFLSWYCLMVQYLVYIVLVNSAMLFQVFQLDNFYKNFIHTRNFSV